jgi:type IV secretory pathway TraG/TraD family ATPase VirD4
MAKIFFAGKFLPERAGETHFMIVGTTGSGKTITFRLIMNSLIPSFFQKDETGNFPRRRAVIFDEKQDVYSFLRQMKVPLQAIYLLNPFDSRCHAWNMAEDVTGPDTALQIATIFIPEERGSQNRFFSDAARAILTGVIRAFIEKGRKQAGGPQWFLSDILAVMREPDLIKHVLAQSNEKYLIKLYLQEGKTANDILATAGAFLAPFETVGALWKQAQEKGRHISLRRFLQENAVLVLGNYQEARAPIEAVNRLVFQRLTQLVLAQPENPSEERQKQRTWFFLDELRKLGQLPGLDDLMNNGRSKGACVVIGFQDIQGLKAVYDEEVTDELTGLCNNFAVLRLSGVATPRWAAQLFGEERGKDVTQNEGIQNATTGGISFSQGEGESPYQRTLYFDATFKQIPIVRKPDYGVMGYYLSPFMLSKGKINPFPKTLEWNEIDAALPNALQAEGQPWDKKTESVDTDTANFCPWLTSKGERDEAIKYLAALEGKDWGRLGLSPYQEVVGTRTTGADEPGRGHIPAPSPEHLDKEPISRLQREIGGGQRIQKPKLKPMQASEDETAVKWDLRRP